MSKLTIKYYRNTLYEQPSSGKAPIYIRVTYKRRSNNFSSFYVNYPISKDAFESDADIQNRIKYETSMIEFIVDSAEKEKIEGFSLKDIKKIIWAYSESVQGLFDRYYISSHYKDIISTIIDRTYKYSGLSKQDYSLLFNYDSNWFDQEVYKSLIKLEDISTDLKDRFKYCLALYEFGEIIQKREDIEIFLCFNIMSWFKMGYRDLFLEFIRSKKIFDEEKILAFTCDFDQTLARLVRLSIRDNEFIDMTYDDLKKRTGKASRHFNIMSEICADLFK